MANETTNNTAETNETSEGNLTAILDTVEESGLLDTLMDEPLLMAMACLLYTSPSPRDRQKSRMPSSA